MSQKQLGDYAIVKELGEGTLGTLYLAEHRFLKRPFAVKILPEDIVSDPAFIDKFQKEVSTLTLLDHPHILKVHNVSFSDGHYFLVTDCVLDEKQEILTLQQYAEKNKGKMTEEILLSLVEQMASALDYVHQKQVGEETLSHKSLKLSNVLVQESDKGPQVFLSDFGLARLIGSGPLLQRTYSSIVDELSLRAKPASTKKGHKNATSEAKYEKLQQCFIENYAFLAPEQKVHASSHIEESKADVYAFGVIVYYLLMNEFPEGYFELPSSRHPDYHYSWDKLITLCMQKDPAKRPSSLVALVEDISNKSQEKKSESGASDTESSIEKPATKLMPHLKPTEITRPQFEPDPGAIFQNESVVVRYQPAAQENKNLEPIMTEMVVISGGSFYRGSNNGGRDEIPRHQIHLNPYAIDVHPVTNEQFVRFLEVMGGEKDGNNNDMIRLRESRIKRTGGKLSIESGYARHPVVGVTWYGGSAYAKWTGKRLPSEAEWEVASAGGLEEALYPTGNNIERTQANFFSSDTTAVMSYPPNDYGVFDMAGNVYEWCHDWYDYHYYNLSVQEPDNPKGPLQGVYRVLRGGCWKSLKEDLRCAHRHRNNPGAMNGTYGFRCVADVIIQ